MPYDFDQLIDRKNTNSLKYDFAKERGKRDDLLPMWVADMDFSTPPEVSEALIDAARHGIFGYSDVKEDYFQVLKSWFASHYNWNIERKWLVKTPGVVFALAMAVRSLTKEGDSILIQRPVYYPFSEAILSNNRKLINNPLIYENGTYSIDYADFERKIVDNQVKLFILCNPHNPVGRVLTEEELTLMGDICVKHGVLVVSDEIHADFIHPGHSHVPFASIKEEYANISVTCTAPSKTFNLAGLQVSNVFIPNPALKKKFKTEINKSGYSQLNTMGLIACKAAYQYGEEWLEELKAYIYDNIITARDFIEKEIPALKVVDTEGTYLFWVDFNELGMEEADLEDFITEKAGLWLDGGTMFGPEGKGFQRFNLACPKSTLLRALNQLRDAINSL